MRRNDDGEKKPTTVAAPFTTYILLIIKSSRRSKKVVRNKHEQAAYIQRNAGAINTYTNSTDTQTHTGILMTHGLMSMAPNFHAIAGTANEGAQCKLILSVYSVNFTRRVHF